MLKSTGKGRQVKICALCVQLAFSEVFFCGVRDLENLGYVNNPSVLFTQG